MNINKSKPIKKIMIFTIITVMIVSLFAVPAFASVHVAWLPVDTSTTLDAITIAGFQNIDYGSKSTDGMYALVFDNLYADILDIAPSSNINLFPNFIGIGYLEIKHDNRTVYYLFGSYLDYEGDDLTVSIGYDTDLETYCLYIGNFYGSTDAITVGGATCTFYFSQYPPVEITGGSNVLFWNDSATYNVYMVSEGSVTPDPVPPSGGDDGEGDTTGIFAVWSQITQWIVNGLASVSNAFYANGELTLLGTLCLIPLGLGLALLLISIIQKFLHLRG